MKICTKCKRELDDSCFAINRKSKDNLQRYCRDCTKQYYFDRKAKRKSFTLTIGSGDVDKAVNTLITEATNILKAAYILKDKIKGEENVNQVR